MTDKHKQEVTRLKQIFENYKQQVENEILPCYFAEDGVMHLKKEEKRLRAFLKFMGADDEILQEISMLITETEQLLHDILDIVDIERKNLGGCHD